MNAILQSTRNFLLDEEGAQIIEYALIIAVVSIALIIAMKALSTTSFSGWITKVTECLKGAATCV